MPSVCWYWVNPNFIWNGDRLAFVKEYRKKATNQNSIKVTNSDVLLNP